MEIETMPLGHAPDHDRIMELTSDSEEEENTNSKCVCTCTKMIDLNDLLSGRRRDRAKFRRHGLVMVIFGVCLRHLVKVLNVQDFT